MTRPISALVMYARSALRISGNELAARMGVSRRTGQRWSHGRGPYGPQVHNLARLVFPVDAALAAEIAAAGGTTLEALGVLPPPPPPAAATVPPSAPARVAPPDRVVDAVVCAAAEAMHVVPQDVRAALLAAFACAKELGLTVDDVERALRAKGPKAG